MERNESELDSRYAVGEPEHSGFGGPVTGEATNGDCDDYHITTAPNATTKTSAEDMEGSESADDSSYLADEVIPGRRRRRRRTETENDGCQDPVIGDTENNESKNSVIGTTEHDGFKNPVKTFNFHDGRRYNVDVTAAVATWRPSLQPTGQVQGEEEANGCRRLADPRPRPTKKPVDEYVSLVHQIRSVHNNLDSIRMNLRHHIRRPRLSQDLNIGKLRAQLDEIEARLSSKDVSETHKNVDPYDHLPKPEVVVADTLPFVMNLVDDIITAWQNATPSTAVLAMDSEGVDMGRNGSLLIVQLYIPSSNQVYLLDVQTLGADAFTTKGSTHGSTLKELLESRDLVKVWWDCRADSDAFYALYGVRLAGVVDVQLVANVTCSKPKARTGLGGLDRLLDDYVNLSNEDGLAFQDITKTGWYGINKVDCVLPPKDSENQNSTPQFRVRNRAAKRKEANVIPTLALRPLYPIIIEYCVQNVVVLPLFLKKCMESNYWSQEWKTRVQKQSTSRLKLARSPGYYPGKFNMHVAPKGWPELPRVDQVEECREWNGSVDLTWPADGF